MTVPASAPPTHVRPLIHALQRPDSCRALGDGDWDRLVRVARSARLLGTLGERLRIAGVWPALPAAVRSHLAGAAAISAHRRQMLLFELASAARAIRAATAAPIVLLKGAAYIAQELPIAAGRTPEDTDIMLPRSELPRAEQALVSSGWRFEKNDPYDQHFYRAWSHELPPMRFPGHAMELDLHHAILSPLGRVKPDTAALFAAARAAGGYQVLHPADQVLHACAHLFQDSDCTNRLRDLFDIYGLLGHFGQTEPDFWSTLWHRAHLHQLQVPLGHALHFVRGWFGVEMPAGPSDSPSHGSGLFRRMAARTLAPVDPDVEAGPALHLCSASLELRAIWLRMPPLLLLYHAANKVVRSLRPGTTAAEAS